MTASSRAEEKLKQLVADLALDKQILQDALKGKLCGLTDGEPWCGRHACLQRLKPGRRSLPANPGVLFD